MLSWKVEEKFQKNINQRISPARMKRTKKKYTLKEFLKIFRISLNYIVKMPKVPDFFKRVKRFFSNPMNKQFLKFQYEPFPATKDKLKMSTLDANLEGNYYERRYSRTGPSSLWTSVKFTDEEYLMFYYLSVITSRLKVRIKTQHRIELIDIINQFFLYNISNNTEIRARNIFLRTAFEQEFFDVPLFTEDRSNIRFQAPPEPLTYDEKNHHYFFDSSVVVNDRRYYNYIVYSPTDEEGRDIEDHNDEDEASYIEENSEDELPELPFIHTLNFVSNYRFPKYTDEISYNEFLKLNSHYLFLFFELDFYVISDIFSTEYPSIKKDFMLNYSELLSFYNIDYFLSLVSIFHLQNFLKKISNKNTSGTLFTEKLPIPLKEQKFHIDSHHIFFNYTMLITENLNYFFFDRLKYTGETFLPYQALSEKGYRKNKEAREDSIMFFNTLKRFSIQTSFVSYPFFSLLFPIFNHFHLLVFFLSNFEQNSFHLISSLRFDFFSLFSSYLKLKMNLIFRGSFSEKYSTNSRTHGVSLPSKPALIKGRKHSLKVHPFPFFRRHPRTFLSFSPKLSASTDTILLPLIHYLFSYFCEKNTSTLTLFTRKLVSRYFFSRFLFLLRTNHEIIFNTIFRNFTDVHFQDIF
jgi:hypothetical protein